MIEIANISQYTQAVSADRAGRWLYRGHCRASYPLIPALLREPADAILAHWTALENVLLRDFIKQATPLLRTQPRDVLDWLALAQHHGVPTRLLDWTTSPLVALYFALEPHAVADLGEDAVVWQFHPRSELADSGGIEQIEAWQDAHAGKLEFDCALFFPPHHSPRITSQQGCFTLHSLPEKWQAFVPLEDQAERSGDLVKIVIPRSSCRRVWVELVSLGVNRYTLFPDLEGLAHKLRFDLIARTAKERGVLRASR